MINKIALVGTHCAGKSTVIKELKEILYKEEYDVGIGHEVTRACPYNLNKKATFLTQWYCMSRQIEMESELGKQYDQLFLDRSVYDVLAYSYRQIQHHMMSVEEYLVLQQAMDAWVDYFPYRALIQLEPLDIVEDDGVRDVDKEYQIEIYDVINRIFTRNIPKITKVYHIKSMDKDERNEQVYNIVSGIFRK